MYNGTKFRKDIRLADELNEAAAKLEKACAEYRAVNTSFRSCWNSDDGNIARNALSTWESRMRSDAKILRSTASKIKRTANQLYEEYKRAKRATENAAGGGGGGRF